MFSAQIRFSGISFFYNVAYAVAGGYYFATAAMVKHV